MPNWAFPGLESDVGGLPSIPAAIKDFRLHLFLGTRTWLAWEAKSSDEHDHVNVHLCLTCQNAFGIVLA